MTKEEVRLLSIALKKAQEESMKFADSEDGGSCNFDTPVLFLKATRKQLQGLPLTKIDYGSWKGGWFVEIPIYGMGNRRTRMAEAIAKSLNESGFNAGVYYQLD